MLLNSGDRVLVPLRKFYEAAPDGAGPSLAYLLQSIERINFEIGDAQRPENRKKLSAPADVAFLDGKANHLRRDAFDLLLNLRSLNQRKRDQVRFEDLALGDIQDLATYMATDVRDAFNDAKALAAALEAMPLDSKTVGSFEAQFRKFQQGHNVPRPRSAALSAPNGDVANYLESLSKAGNRSVADVNAKIAAVEKKIDEKNKHFAESLKVPFVDQPIDASTLAWVVPLTAAIGILFCVFYLTRARELYHFSLRLDAEATGAQLMYPWVFLLPRELDTISLYIGRALQLALIGAPIIASGLFLWPALHSTSAYSNSMIAIAVAANLLMALSAAAFIRELVRFSGDWTGTCKELSPPPTGQDAHKQL